ncbi:MAG TPA: (Fe-S)-binding protein [Bacteroidales bacterium]|jgi:Fe-S oxidoreductase|nr:(Fe-S)-binding protein [Bacteroidales bacterium]
MQFDLFVIPFNIGLYFIILYAVTRSIIWFRELSRQDKLRLQRGFFGRAFGQSLKEIFMESLIHRRILKSNFRLGYMHMSLAFGWFLLILFGTIEADVFGQSHLNAPYKAIFFRYFNPEHGRTGAEAAYGFLMDGILAFILSGLLLAVLKRFSSRTVGMKKTTKLRPLDKIALTSLWLIFPSRLLAESFTSGAYATGSFLTGSLGSWLASFLPSAQMAYPFWWLYSLSLGTFFVLLPLTRYMHIPSELFLIFMRNSGIRTGDKAGSFSEVQTFSCSSCGMCIDACQLNLSLGITNIQSAYLLKGIRNDMDVSSIANNCLLCGRCDVKCPVGIELSPIRMIQRRTAESENRYGNTHRGYFRKRFAAAEKPVLPAAYGFLPEVRAEKTDIVFYAGCMTHLSPAIKNSMVRILDASGLKYEFIDKDGGVCCGRPLMLAGRDREARELINHNSELIRKTGAHTLVTSCPICFKVFRESYYLDIEILHHTQFIRMLIDEGYVKMNFSRQRIAWHSPCELGRGSGVYDEPKDILRHVAILEKTAFEDENSLCCGGSLANMKINSEQKNIIARMAAAELTRSNPDILATACPLCKKTLSAATQTRVRDIAEIVADTIAESPAAKVPRRRSISIRQMARY